MALLSFTVFRLFYGVNHGSKEEARKDERNSYVYTGLQYAVARPHQTLQKGSYDLGFCPDVDVKRALHPVAVKAFLCW